MHNLENPREFIFAGKAIFTIQNEKTGNHFTFKVKQAKDQKPVWFVSILNGSDNYSNYAYIGTIFNTDFRWTKKSKVNRESQSFKSFSWVLRNINTLPDFVKVHHEGQCGRCGRRLTVPESIERGIGPECLKKVA